MKTPIKQWKLGARSHFPVPLAQSNSSSLSLTLAHLNISSDFSTNGRSKLFTGSEVFLAAPILQAFKCVEPMHAVYISTEDMGGRVMKL